MDKPSPPFPLHFTYIDVTFVAIVVQLTLVPNDDSVFFITGWSIFLIVSVDQNDRAFSQMS